MRVLIAEDDKTFCEFLKETLEMKGIEVVSCERLRRTSKGLVGPFRLLCTRRSHAGSLGDRSGRLIKKNDPNAKIVLISAFADPALRDSAVSLGAPLFSKPFSPDELLRLLEQTPHSGRANH